MSWTFMEGNEAIAWGAVAAGCDFFAGYPITPATTIYNTMLKILPPQGGICLQAEDEIASIGFCLGASMAGKKVMTATSGPGISLYSENISFAVGSEIPIVIIDVQRLGPSTGSATKAADGDIQFLRWGNTGGLPVIVLAPADVKDCYVLTMHAFNLSEQFRCPVFVAANKEVAMTRETIDLEALCFPAPVNRKAASAGAPFRPFGVSGDALTPDFLPIGDERLVRQTSSTHGPEGYITTSAAEIAANQERLNRKIESAVSGFSLHESIDNPLADTLVIVYGVTTRAAKQAAEMMNASGKSVSLLALKTLWPVPEQLIRTKARNHRRIVVIEMNMGQYVREIERVLAGKQIVFYGRMDGDLITPGRIKEVVTNG